MSNRNLSKARTKINNDEYYTMYDDVFKELVKYKDQFKDKTVYCNCDDKNSAFLYFFATFFSLLGLKRLFTSCLAGYCLEYDGKHMRKHWILGDFRSSDCREILERSDIVITNPPFSMFREWLSVVGQKDFLVISNKNAIAYHNFFPNIKSGRVKLGYNKPNSFYRPDGSVTNKLQGLSRWFTTLEVVNKPVWKPSRLFDGQYAQFDHYPAINIDRVEDIPSNYNGMMGVPITYLDNIDYSSYEILDLISRYPIIEKELSVKGHQLTEFDGKPRYSRLIIRKKN